MTERYFISRVSPDPRNPATSLARIVFRREQAQLQENHFLARDLKLESRRNWSPDSPYLL